MVTRLLQWTGWRNLFARLPLPMLALAASWGVYSFSRLFVPVPVAIIQAAAFELVYIGLAVVELDQTQRKRAQAISIGSVVVSMAYNSIDGLFHRRPALLDQPPLLLDVGLALLHGVPLALLAYLVADLLLHSSSQNIIPSKIIPATSEGLPVALPVSDEGNMLSGRPQSYTLESLLEIASDGRVVRAQALDRLGCSEATLDRLLADGVAAGRLARVDRGVYDVR